MFSCGRSPFRRLVFEDPWVGGNLFKLESFFRLIDKELKSA